jgi:hypothetical protein
MCSYICEAGGTDPNPFNLRGQRGRADWDRRNAFVASYLFSPPVNFSDHWKNVLLSGWTFSGITTIQSGPPISFFSGVDVAVNGTTAAEHAFLTGKSIGISHPNRGAMVTEFFNTAAFVSPICTYAAARQPSSHPEGKLHPGWHPLQPARAVWTIRTQYPERTCL